MGNVHVFPVGSLSYNNREINGREFDFCILMKNVGLIIVEVKGWQADYIYDVAGVDEIVIKGNSKPEKSPKKQARAYRFGLLNKIKERYNVSPLIFDMVCYPFINAKEYKEKRLDIVSEEELTIFKEDLESSRRLGEKILKAYELHKSIPHTEMDENLISKIRQYFEPHFVPQRHLQQIEQTPYSIVSMCLGRMRKKDIYELIEKYFSGTKIIFFADSIDTADSVLYVLEEELNDRKIEAYKNNLKYNSEANNEFEVRDGCFRIFNFELYIVESLAETIDDDVTIYEGKCTDEERNLLEYLSDKSVFNSNQFFIEHANSEKNILVKAGAGTGKTYSMVSRVSFLCNKFERPVVDVINDIALVTFTNDAADNMKRRIKQLFINYFVLTGNPKFLNFIDDTDLMRISTIHKFAREIIQEDSMQMGLGNNFSITAGDYSKERIYEKYLNAFIEKKEADNPNFINEIKIPLYQFRRMLIDFSNQLYNKSIDIKKIGEDELGQAPASLSFFNEVITDVIISAEREYEQSIQESNKIDLREIMILLNDAVSNKNKQKTHLSYKYIFIDEFQDTDDAQIDSFLKIQKMIGNECRLFVVGDLKQSIYRFRGATISAFERLHSSPESWEEYTINTNYRTDSRLLAKLDEIFKSMGTANWLPYTYEKDHLVSHLECGASNENLLRCIPYHGKQGEQFEALLKLIKLEKTAIEALEKKRSLSKEERTIAILVRENWQIDTIIKECKRLDESIDIDIETKVGGDLYQLDSTLDFCKLLLALSNPSDPVCLVNFIESNYVAGSPLYQGLQNYDEDTQVFMLSSFLDDYLEERMEKTWADLLNYVQANPILVVLKNIYDALQPWVNYSGDNSKQRFYRSNYDLMIEKIIKSYRVDYLSLAVITNSIQINILTRQQELARNTYENSSDITILCTTVHKAKGLEYGTVILPYTFQRIDNLKKADTDVNYSGSKLAYLIKVGENKKDFNSNYNSDEEINQRVCEEARILYVALTRAIRSCVWMKDLDRKSAMNWCHFLEV